MEFTKNTSSHGQLFYMLEKKTLQSDLPELERQHKGTHERSPLELII